MNNVAFWQTLEMMKFLYFILLITLIQQTQAIGQEDANTTKLPVQMAIPPSAKLSLSGSDMQLQLIKGSGTQQVLTPNAVGEIWINYSSVVEPNTTNTIYASLTTDELPPEIAIKLKVGKDVGAGQGQTGSPTIPIILSSNPQAIITNIGSCFTGQGINKGHLLSYSWDLLPNFDPEIIKKDDLNNLTVGVIYTIVTDE